MKLTWQIVQFQLKETFAIAYGNYSFREALIVTLESHGCKGYGECTAIDYYHIDLASFTTQLDKWKNSIESKSIKHPKDFYIFLEALQLPSFLRSALDCAYWDLFGKLEQCSFLALNAIDYEMLPESSITISVDEVAKQIKKIEQSSWNHFKVKCNRLNKDEIAQLLALNKPIALDSNGSFIQSDCLWLETYAGIENFTYLEQPMKPGVEQYAVLHADGKANWMADEDSQDAAKLKDLVPHYNSINIKLVKCGGLTPALQMIAEARALGFQLMIGCMTESSIGISAGAVLAPLCDYADLDGANLIANDIAIGSTIVDGVIQLSDGNGLGIKIN